MNRGTTSSKRHKLKKKRATPIIAAGVVLAIVDLALLAYLFVPDLLRPSASAVSSTEIVAQDVSPLIKKSARVGAKSTLALAQLPDPYAPAAAYEPHSRFGYYNFDWARYLQDSPDIEAPDDENFLVYKHMVMTGVAEGREIHATDPIVDAVLSSGGAEKEALLTELRDVYYAGSLIDGWDRTTYTQEEEDAIVQYMSDAVFIGDSVMLGFSNFCAGSDDAFFHPLKFLTAGSYSLREALKADGEFHPIFQGRQQPVWESVAALQSKKVFLFFGLNDMMITTQVTEQYKALIANILEGDPDARIVILSATPPYENRNRLTGENIAAFNEVMRYEAGVNGWDYLDVATPLSDGEGMMLEAYTSDEFVHVRPEGYEIWGNILKAYVYRQLYGDEDA